MALTQKMKIFCELYAANGGNGTQAAIGAGYSEESAYSIANENLNKPEIVKYLQTLTKPAQDERIQDATQRQVFLTKVTEGKVIVNKNQLKACELLSRMQGDFKDNVIHSGSVQLPVVIGVVGV